MALGMPYLPYIRPVWAGLTSSPAGILLYDVSGASEARPPLRGLRDVVKPSWFLALDLARRSGDAALMISSSRAPPARAACCWRSRCGVRPERRTRRNPAGSEQA